MRSGRWLAVAPLAVVLSASMLLPGPVARVAAASVTGHVVTWPDNPLVRNPVSLSAVTRIAAGGDRSLAIDALGVRGWGRWSAPPLQTAVRVACGGEDGMALLGDHSWRHWDQFS